MDAISITGLQATGKTTLARALGRALDAVVFSRDPLMDVLLADGVPMVAAADSGLSGIGQIGYDLQTALLRSQLAMNRSVILECVVGDAQRAEWRAVAEAAGADFWLIDTVCSDPQLHRRRFQERGLTQRGDWVLEWETVERNRQLFLPHPQTNYIADSARPYEDNVRSIVQLIQHRGAEG
ncbi:MAG TPA: AAA family ATPase [Mycobacteriales bacterium]|nr:AAA family ATPase [Mycobacteriales bacterium]